MNGCNSVKMNSIDELKKNGENICLDKFHESLSYKRRKKNIDENHDAWRIK